MTAEIRPWPTDPRFLASSDGFVIGPSGRRIGVRDKRSGYILVSYRTPEKRTTTGAHVVVCEAFHGPRPSGMEAAHENGIRDDNRPENLRWDTHEGNQRDQVRHGTRKSILTEEAVREIRASTESTRRAGLRYGVSQVTIVHIRNRKTWREVS